MWLTEREVSQIGLKSVGDGVQISRHAHFYNPQNISIGPLSRIDDFCLVSAGREGIEIGRNVHVSAYTSMVGNAKITLEDYSGLSNKVSVFSSSDDFTNGMSNPTVPDEYRRLIDLPVTLKRHALVGANSVLLPGSYVGEGTSVGAHSVVRKKLLDWMVYSGNPLRKISERSKIILELESQYANNRDI